MTTYVYETIPQHEGEKPECFEMKQNMQDAPLTRHPDTGRPVRRVILGGYGFLTSGSPAREECCKGEGGCDGSGCCHS